MRIAVTGARGRLGCAIVEACAQHHDLVALSHQDLDIRDASAVASAVDRIAPDHKLVHVAVKLKAKRDLNEVSAMMIGRAKQAHHNIEDIEITDLEAELARSYENFLNQMHGWTIVLMSLAATVLLVGGVGVLSVMLISFSDRRYEIGLRKAMGASDHEVFIQFLLEALVLAAVGALAGTVAGAALCQALSSKFPYGLVVNPVGLLVAWATALALALVFGMYPAVRASRLSPASGRGNNKKKSRGKPRLFSF